MDVSLLTEWAAALRGIADEMETVAGVQSANAFVPPIVSQEENVGVYTPNTHKFFTEPKQTKEPVEEYRQTSYETAGDRVATIRNIEHALKHGYGPIKLVRLDKSEYIIKDAVDIIEAFS